jgi:membrane protein implicated in regulation of membrane protease activity
VSGPAQNAVRVRFATFAEGVRKTACKRGVRFRQVLLAIAIILAFLVLPWPLGLILVIVAGLFEIGEIYAWRRWLSRYRISAGAEALVGMPVEVIEACTPRGRARLRGEIWNARSATPLPTGASATVAAVDGLVLDLKPAEETDAPSDAGG